MELHDRVPDRDAGPPEPEREPPDEGDVDEDKLQAENDRHQCPLCKGKGEFTVTMAGVPPICECPMCRGLGEVRRRARRHPPNPRHDGGNPGYRDFDYS